MSPRVSVIIVTFRSAATIGACLKSVQACAVRLSGGSGAAEGLEIIVVDNASGDGTTERVRQTAPEAKLIVNRTNRGFSHAVNQGARMSAGDYLFLLNPDCRMEPDGIGHLVDFLDSMPKAGACGPKILSPDGSLQLSCRAFPDHSTALFHRHSLLTRLFPRNPHSDRYLKTRWDHESRARVDWVSGAAVLLRRDAFQRVGGMDEDYFLYCEDVDLCWRLNQHGWATYFVPEAVVHHHVGRSSRQVPYRALYERHRSMYTFYRKHYSQNIPLIDFATFVGIGLRCLMLLGLASSGRGIAHHGQQPRRAGKPARRSARP